MLKKDIVKKAVKKLQSEDSSMSHEAKCAITEIYNALDDLSDAFGKCKKALAGLSWEDLSDEKSKELGDNVHKFVFKGEFDNFWEKIDQEKKKLDKFTY